MAWPAVAAPMAAASSAPPPIIDESEPPKLRRGAFLVGPLPARRRPGPAGAISGVASGVTEARELRCLSARCVDTRTGPSGRVRGVGPRARRSEGNGTTTATETHTRSNGADPAALCRRGDENHPFGHWTHSPDDPW